MSKTLGERRVRIDFNPTKDGVVNTLKQKSADLINMVEGLKHEKGDEKPDPEKLRLIALAQTHYEDAAVWAVKAATYAKE